MNFDGIADFLKPRLRLFLSADLIGSTALKQGEHYPLEPSEINDLQEEVGAFWFHKIAHFYRRIEVIFSDELQKYSGSVAAKFKWPINHKPELWKVSGDELIYTSEINDPREAFACVMCWLRTLRIYRKELGNDNSPLDIKGSCWVAGFPVANTEVIFAKNIDELSTSTMSASPTVIHFFLLDSWYEKSYARSGMVKDFIGPSMDTGFRISSLASARKLTISLELALILSMVIPVTDYRDEFFLRFDSKVVLKGVLGGRPYPVFWLDTMYDDNLTKFEDRLTNFQHQDIQNLRNYCLEFIQTHKRYLFQPFIRNCDEPLLSLPPEQYESYLQKLNAKWLQEKQRLNIATKATQGESPPNDDRAEDVTDEEIIDFVAHIRED